MAPPGPTPTGPRELTGIVDLTRGKDHPTARLLDLIPGRSGTVHENWLAERGEDFRAGVRIATLDPLPGTARTPSLGLLHGHNQRARRLLHRHARRQRPRLRYAAASSKTPWVTADAKVTPSTWFVIFCAPHTRKLTPRQQERLREAFVADEAHISVEVAYHYAQQVRDVFHQDTPAQGRRLTAHLVERLPTCPTPEIARPGQTLRKRKDALDAHFDTGEANNAPH